MTADTAAAPAEADLLDGPGNARALLDAVVAIGSDLHLQPSLQRLVETACRLTGARYGFLGVFDDDGRIGTHALHGITDEQVARIARFPLGLGILRTFFDDPRPLRLTDLTQHPESAGFPPGHPPMRSFLGLPIVVRDEIYGNLYLTEKQDGAQFTDEDEALLVALAQAAGTLIGNARAYARSERRRRWLEASASLSDRLRASASTEAALAAVAEVAASASGAGVVAVIQDAGHGPEVVALEGDAAVLRAVGMDRLAPVLEQVERGACPLVAGPEMTDGRGGAERAPVVVVPLRTRVAGGGLLLLAWSETRDLPDEEERSRLVTYAEQAALGLDRGQAVTDREELVLLADRERIARDLHDLVIQRLFATGLQLQGVKHLAVNEAVRQRIDDTVAELDVTIHEIRSTIFELQHPREESLRAEVRALASEYADVLGFAPEVRLRGPVDSAVDEVVADHLLATLREALSNVARHAGATAVVVEVVVEDGKVALRVVDDGCGLPEGRHESGLRNARRRAAERGGTLRVGGPAAGPTGTGSTGTGSTGTGSTGTGSTGTELVWQVPLAEPAPARA